MGPAEELYVVEPEQPVEETRKSDFEQALDDELVPELPEVN